MGDELVPDPFETNLGLLLPPVPSLAFFFAGASPCSPFISSDVISSDSLDFVSVSEAVSMLEKGISLVGQS